MRIYARTSRRTAVSVGPLGAIVVIALWMAIIALLVKLALLVAVIAAGFAVWFVTMLGLYWLQLRFRAWRAGEAPTERMER